MISRITGSSRSTAEAGTTVEVAQFLPGRLVQLDAAAVGGVVTLAAWRDSRSRGEGEIPGVATMRGCSTGMSCGAAGGSAIARGPGTPDARRRCRESMTGPGQALAADLEQVLGASPPPSPPPPPPLFRRRPRHGIRTGAVVDGPVEADVPDLGGLAARRRWSDGLGQSRKPRRIGRIPAMPSASACSVRASASGSGTVRQIATNPASTTNRRYSQLLVVFSICFEAGFVRMAEPGVDRGRSGQIGRQPAPPARHWHRARGPARRRLAAPPPRSGCRRAASRRGGDGRPLPARPAPPRSSACSSATATSPAVWPARGVRIRSCRSDASDQASGQPRHPAGSDCPG